MTLQLNHAVPVPDTDHEPLPEGTLTLVLELCHELWRAGVRYCHWKSNDALDRSATGENDLDLLVHRADAQTFAAVLARLGFRRALAPAGREHPGVSHHYGLDPTGAYVHVHAHFQLVLGDDTSKNVRLPLEVAYLASSRCEHVFPTPAPEFELAVFVVRMMLKHATWDAVAIGNGRLGAAERRELAWLTTRADLADVRRVVARHLSGIGATLWEECLDALVRGDDVAAVTRRMVLMRRLSARLRPHARRGPLRDTATRFGRRAQWAVDKLVLRRPARKRMERVGATIALIGGDGAGKSTAVQATADWLGGPLLVHRTHLGKPRPSLLTLAVKGPMYLARAAGLLPGTGAVVDPRTARPEDFPGHAWMVWHLLTARDRLRAYRRARRIADRGGLVVSDRWPLPQIRLMDGARTTWVLEHPDRFGPVTRALARAEQRSYGQIGEPDVLVVLRLDPEVAVARRTDEASDFVRVRNTEIFDLDWSATDAVVVDATRPPAEVLAEVRRAVWDRL
jgi:hypothetical protein